jgi:hypothetical protein
MNKKRIEHLIREGFNCYKTYIDVNDGIMFTNDRIYIIGVLCINKNTLEFVNDSKYDDNVIKNILKRCR